jgi:hypothetical protein
MVSPPSNHQSVTFLYCHRLSVPSRPALFCQFVGDPERARLPKPAIDPPHASQPHNFAVVSSVGSWPNVFQLYLSISLQLLWGPTSLSHYLLRT